MARKLNDLEVSVIFDRCWEIYSTINDAKYNSAKLAFSFAHKQGHDVLMIEVAIKIYALETKGDEYHYQLGNLIRDDHWKDYVGDHVDYKSYLATLEKKERAAQDLLAAWNQGIPSHWCPVLDLHSKIPLAKRALADKAFAENWKEALDLARKIFYKPIHSTDFRSKIILSFGWFTKLGEKHTVMRLKEREYGTPERPGEIRETGFSQKEYDSTITDVARLWDEIKKESPIDLGPL